MTNLGMNNPNKPDEVPAPEHHEHGAAARTLGGQNY